MKQTFPKYWILALFVVLLLVLARWFVNSPSVPTQEVEIALEPSRSTTFEQMLAAGGDAIYVENQTSGQVFVQVGFVVLSQPGYVVIFDDDSGIPGRVVGASDLLQDGGEHLRVVIDQVMEDDQVYYAVLYHDNQDGVFTMMEDVQVIDAEQSVVMMSFLAQMNAVPESGPVNP